jgi:hypothetical protein
MAMATKWLEERWANLIPALEPLGNDKCEEIRAICEAEKEWWRKRPGIKKQGSLGKPMTDTRNHIREVLEVRDDNSWINPKTGVSEHIALKYMNFSTEEWRQMALPADVELQARLAEVLELRDPGTVVALGERLLRMSAWPELVLGIGLNTGRSLAEILKTGIWHPKTSYSLLFSGPMTVYEKMCPFFEIPTFSRAEVVLEAISRVREMFGMQFAYVTRRDVGRQCGPMVRQVTYQYFGDLVPTRRDGDLYQALARGVYSRLSAYYYCPPEVDELLYMATVKDYRRILEAQSEEERLTFAVAGSFLDYMIVDVSGIRDESLGVRLGEPEVELLEVFQKGEPEKPVQPDGESEVVTTQSSLRGGDGARWAE